MFLRPQIFFERNIHTVLHNVLNFFSARQGAKIGVLVRKRYNLSVNSINQRYFENPEKLYV